jgi:hypothetical protein
VSASWQDARWADASGLVDWLDTKVTTRVIGETNARRVRFWRKDGGLADFYALDRILTAAGLHPSDVPEHLFGGPITRGRPSPASAPASGR